MMRLSLIALGLCALGACAPANAQEGMVYVIRPGTSRTLQSGFISMNAQCRQLPLPRLSLVEGPSYGRVAFGVGRAHPSFGPDGHQHCNNRIGKASAVVYRAPMQQVDDSFTVRVRFSDGEIRQQSYSIQVR
jgi:hypothetical protein